MQSRGAVCLKQLLQDIIYDPGLAERIEMQYGAVVLQEVAALVEEPFGAYLFAVGLGFGFHHFVAEFYRYLGIEHPGNGGELFFVGEGLKAGYDWGIHTELAAPVHIVVIMHIVEEQLCGNIICAEVYFLFKVIDVGVHVWRLHVFFGVAGHPYAEICFGTFYNVFFHVVAIVESHDLAHQVFGIAVAMGVWGKEFFVGSGIATEGEDVFDAEEVEVYECVLGLGLAESAADEVGDGLYLILVHDGGADAHGARALAYLDPFEGAIAAGLEYLFGTVVGDIDEGGFELHQRIEVGVGGLNTFALGRGEYLKRYDGFFFFGE